MKLLDLIEDVNKLAGHTSSVLIGGLAQILWARKTHTDDLDLVLAAADLSRAHDQVVEKKADPRWALPEPANLVHESNDVFEVYHLLFSGAVVDLLAFHDRAFNDEILATPRVVAELRNIRVVCPELLLVMHLLRPGPQAALAATALTIARQQEGDLDLAYTRRWARHMNRSQRLERVLEQAKAFQLM